LRTQAHTAAATARRARYREPRARAARRATATRRRPGHRHERDANLRHPERVTGPTGAPRAWLYTVARHLAIDQYRARQARPAEPADLTALASRAAPDQIDAAIAQADLATALASLRPRDRDLLTARYLRDRSIGQIAADLNIPAGTIKSRLSTARDALRRNLQPGNG
jgi:RNA polymerase sigma-70 factor, ECF subfamily